MNLGSYWQKAHEETDLRSLSGHSLHLHVECLDVADLLPTCRSVLCVGVGEGQWVRDLAKLGHQVSSLDISSLAASRVPGPFYQAPTALPSSVFDLALSMWVTPHMDRDALEAQTREVIRALGPKGVYAMHYCSPEYSMAEPDCRPDFFSAVSARMYRKPRTVWEMVERCGGQVVRDDVYCETPQYAIHLRRAWIVRKGV